MKETRKLVQHGKATLITSLPSKWVKEHGLKKGDEVRMETQEDTLILMPLIKNATVKKVTLDMKGVGLGLFDSLIQLVHKMGYDEVEILFDNKEVPRKAQTRISEMLVGYEIVEQSLSRLLIKTLSPIQSEEFEKLLKRLFMVTTTFSKEMLEELGKTKKKRDLLALLNLEETINRISNMCERLLVKSIPSDKRVFYYFIAWNLESIGDHYRNICKYVEEEKIDLSKKTLDIFFKVNMLLEVYANMYYTFALEKINDLRKQQKTIKKEIKDYLKKVKEKKELFILMELFGIVTRITDAIGCTTAVCAKELAQ